MNRTFDTDSRIELQLEVERLVAYEVYLLDERRFHEWLALFTEDATYAVAVREVVQSTEEDRGLYRYPEVPVFDEDIGFTSVRVKRLETRLAHAEQPASLTRHLITNVLVHENGGDDGLPVSAHFQVYQHRPGVSEQVFYGKREDLLRRVDNQWRIARRQVVLDTSLLPSTISIFF
jgi:3-phenylpropionate/cinnamic acid dioxygenase small subunit